MADNYISCCVFFFLFIYIYLSIFIYMPEINDLILSYLITVLIYVQKMPYHCKYEINEE